MIPLAKEKWDWVSLQGAAASTQYTLYMPIGYPAGISAAARAVGIHRRIQLKEIVMLGESSNIRFYEVGYWTRDGKTKVLWQSFQAATGAGVPIGQTNEYDEMHQLLEHRIEDLECIYFVVGNVNAGATESYAFGVRYEPLL